MRAWRAGVVVYSIVVIGCVDGGSPAVPEAPELGELTEGGSVYFVCPDGIQPEFSSLYSQMMATDSCGTDRKNSCHSQNARANGNPLDFSLGAAAVYTEFLGADGGGARAADIAGAYDGSTPLIRVVPGNPDQSYLYIKLNITNCMDPQYGCGMPYDHPGSVCPATLQAVHDWINQGAKND